MGAVRIMILFGLRLHPATDIVKSKESGRFGLRVHLRTCSVIEFLKDRQTIKRQF